MDAVAHDGTVDMGFRGVPVALNGPVILDLLVLRFSLFPAQGGSPPASRTEGGKSSLERTWFCDLMVVILVICLGRGHGRITPQGRPEVGPFKLEPQVR